MNDFTCNECGLDFDYSESLTPEIDIPAIMCPNRECLSINIHFHKYFDIF